MSPALDADGFIIHGGRKVRAFERSRRWKGNWFLVENPKGTS
jgi:hypothetical protein